MLAGHIRALLAWTFFMQGILLPRDTKPSLTF